VSAYISDSDNDVLQFVFPAPSSGMTIMGNPFGYSTIGTVGISSGSYVYVAGDSPSLAAADPIDFAATPEPGFYGVLAIGLGGLAYAVRKRAAIRTREIGTR
jgi:hypothetical protein